MWGVCFLLLLFNLINLSVPSIGLAISVQRLSLEQLARQADLIVKGRIQDIRNQTSQDRSAITTVVVLPIEKQWKGPNVSMVTVRQPGGSAGEITQRVMGLPEFAVGEEVVLFLRKQADGRYATVGGKQGKFTVRINPQSGKEMIEDLTGKEQELGEFLSRLKETLSR